MSEFWRTVLEALKPTSLAAVFFVVLGYVVRNLFRQWMKHDLEGYKAKLAQLAADHQSELDRAIFEHQTRFSRMHERRAEVIEQLYEKLILTEGYFSQLIRQDRDENELPGDEKLNQLAVYASDFSRHFWFKRIFLDAPLCEKIDQLLATITEGTSDYRTWRIDGLSLDEKRRFFQGVREAEKAVPEIRAAIEGQFRSVLGVGCDKAEALMDGER